MTGTTGRFPPPMSTACIWCKFCDWPTFANGIMPVIELTACCFQPDVVATRSPVTGPNTGKSARLARMPDGPCGPDGKYFQQRTQAP
jgi:hypothetical protein